MIIADTGFWLAIANRRDQHHPAAVHCLDTLTEPLITTWPVLTETCHLLLRRVSRNAETAFIQACDQGAFEIFEMTQSNCGRLRELMHQYSDLPMDLADASLVLLAENLGHGRILSTDQPDFRTYRWKQRQPFENLLLPDG